MQKAPPFWVRLTRRTELSQRNIAEKLSVANGIGFLPWVVLGCQNVLGHPTHRSIGRACTDNALGVGRDNAARDAVYFWLVAFIAVPSKPRPFIGTLPGAI